MVYVVTLFSQFLSTETRMRVAEHQRVDPGLRLRTLSSPPDVCPASRRRRRHTHGRLSMVRSLGEERVPGRNVSARAFECRFSGNNNGVDVLPVLKQYACITLRVVPRCLHTADHLQHVEV